MKIHQLPLGARFEFEGEEYVKTGPLFGTGPRGPRLIPKYAVLRSLEPTAAAPEPAREHPLARARVLQAFDAFCARCRTLVPDERGAALEEARRAFLDALG
ncbi:MAG: hypothetical protein ACM3Y9_02470 [Ignavibacteria bacterium]